MEMRASFLSSTQSKNALSSSLGFARQRDAAARPETRDEHRSGYSPYLEQPDAERALLSTELALVQVRVDRLNSAVILYQALGGGWDGSSVSDDGSREPKVADFWVC